MRKHGLSLGPRCRIVLLVVSGLMQALASAYAEPGMDRRPMHGQTVAGSVQSSAARDEPAEYPVTFTSCRQRSSDGTDPM